MQMTANARIEGIKRDSEQKQRFRAWLNTARCRLAVEDYATFRPQLRAVREVEAEAEEAALRDLASILWRAEFPEGQQTHEAWLHDFCNCLPETSRSIWPACIRAASPFVPAQSREEVAPQAHDVEVNDNVEGAAGALAKNDIGVENSVSCAQATAVAHEQTARELEQEVKNRDDNIADLEWAASEREKLISDHSQEIAEVAASAANKLKERDSKIAELVAHSAPRSFDDSNGPFLPSVDDAGFAADSGELPTAPADAGFLANDRDVAPASEVETDTGSLRPPVDTSPDDATSSGAARAELDAAVADVLEDSLLRTVQHAPDIVTSGVPASSAKLDAAGSQSVLHSADVDVGARVEKRVHQHCDEQVGLGDVFADAVREMSPQPFHVDPPSSRKRRRHLPFMADTAATFEGAANTCGVAASVSTAAADIERCVAKVSTVHSEPLAVTPPPPTNLALLASLVAGRAAKTATPMTREQLPLCMVCRQLPKRPKVAAFCGHFACRDCWDQWMVLKFECPVCRKKVRPSNLIELKGWCEEQR